MTEFVTPYSLHSSDEKQIGMLQVFRNIATKETISVTEEWNDKYDTDKKYWEDNFMEQINCKLPTVQANNHFQMYKSKPIYSIYYFSIKSVVPSFILSQYPMSILSFCHFLINSNQHHYFLF